MLPHKLCPILVYQTLPEMFAFLAAMHQSTGNQCKGQWIALLPTKQILSKLKKILFEELLHLLRNTFNIRYDSNNGLHARWVLKMMHVTRKETLRSKCHCHTKRRMGMRGTPTFHNLTLLTS